MLKLKPVMLALAAVVGCSGCMTPDVTRTTRSGVEQLLISNAVDRACHELDTATLQGRTLFLDTSNLEAVDKGYILATLRQQLHQAGATLTDKPEKAELTVELVSGAVGTDQDSMLIGLPAIPLPMPMVGTIKTPEIALFKKDIQTAIARLSLYRSPVKGADKPVSSPPLSGSAYFSRWTLLIVVHWSTSDLPEKARHYAH